MKHVYHGSHNLAIQENFKFSVLEDVLVLSCIISWAMMVYYLNKEMPECVRLSSFRLAFADFAEGIKGDLDVLCFSSARQASQHASSEWARKVLRQIYWFSVLGAHAWIKTQV